MTSQRVLSGSKTKGSSASLTGSVQYFYQGTSVRTFSSFVGSLLPRIGVGDRIELYKDGSPLDTFNEFDDSIVINNNSAERKFKEFVKPVDPEEVCMSKTENSASQP